MKQRRRNRRPEHPMRESHLLATEAQVWRLQRMGYSEEAASIMTRGEAHQLIGEYFKAEKELERTAQKQQSATFSVPHTEDIIAHIAAGRPVKELAEWAETGINPYEEESDELTEEFRRIVA